MDPQLQVLHLTDFHLCSDPERRVAGELPLPNLNRVIDAMRTSSVMRTPVALIGGDVAHDGKSSTYELCRRALAPLQARQVAVPGNHDDPMNLASAFPVTEGDIASRFLSIGWGVYLLDSRVAGEEHGLITIDDLDRVTSGLAASSLKHWLLLFHHDVIQDAPGVRPGLINAGVLVEKLLGTRKNVLLLTGHRRMAIGVTLGQLTFLSSPSTCVQFESGSDVRV